MAKWNPLRDKLAATKDRVTFSWAELNQLAGGLPSSAYRYSIFWKGDGTGPERHS